MLHLSKWKVKLMMPKCILWDLGLNIGVVDTPGFGDSCRMKADKDDIKKIIKAWSMLITFV